MLLHLLLLPPLLLLRAYLELAGGLGGSAAHHGGGTAGGSSPGAGLAAVIGGRGIRVGGRGESGGSVSGTLALRSGPVSCPAYAHCDIFMTYIQLRSPDGGTESHFEGWWVLAGAGDQGGEIRGARSKSNYARVSNCRRASSFQGPGARKRANGKRQSTSRPGPWDVGGAARRAPSPPPSPRL
jgi:hypothetical protein